MQLPSLRWFGLTLALAALAACGGGGGGSTSGLKTPCTTGASKFCLASCNLGCSSVGCTVTQIAQNQQLELVFSLPIDPATVNGASVSIKTSGGESPSGSLLVSGNTLRFVPEVRVTGGVTYFGFRANENYILALPGGEGEEQSIRSTSGERLGASVLCNLSVSRGIIDPDGQAPTAKMISPTASQLESAPIGTTIVLEFSEIIDITPFNGATSATSPVQYRIRKTKQEGSKFVCDSQQPSIVLEGVPRAEIDSGRQIAVVTMKPAIQLPSRVCVEVEVTNRVKDLSGKAAVPTTFRFVTEATNIEDQFKSELFQNDGQLDKEVSSGRWFSGTAEPGLIGGDGIHGEFTPTDGVAVPGQQNTYEWNTDSQTISKDMFGKLVTVTDGVFRFTTFKLPKNTTILWKGSKPPRLYVRGSADIQGKMRLNGANQDGSFNAKTNTIGQPGTAGGVAGGVGGQGGDKGNGVNNGGGAFNGRAGDDVRLLAGHGYASRTPNTGGKGGLQFPTSGANIDITYNAFSAQFSGMTPAGGGGGGLDAEGNVGKAIRAPDPNPPTDLGPNSVAGIGFDPLPFPPPNNTLSSLDHFLVGGSGGGGAGSHVFFQVKGQNPSWIVGGGGMGGGGALGFRVGRDLAMSVDGLLEARGGNGFGYTVNDVSKGPPSPGAGGSGGSLILQVGGVPLLGGLLDTSGGKGSTWDLGASFQAVCFGGDGSPGLVRLEMETQPSAGMLGTTIPPAQAKHVGKLLDNDRLVGCQSKWYSTQMVFPPSFLHYVVEAEVNNVKKVFSDDPAKGIFAGRGAGQEIQFMVQGAKVNPTTGQPDPATIGPWREYVGPFSSETLDKDQATGFRFMLTFDRGTSNAKIVVKKVTLGYRG